MNGRITIAGLCMLCALLVSAFAAQSASAVTNGTTAFTCVADPEGPLRGPHCLASGVGNYKHVEIPQDKTTTTTITNANSAGGTSEASTGRLRVTIAGVPLELGTTVVSGSGWTTNAKAVSGEHYTHGEGTLTFTNVEVTKPEGRGCKVYTDNEEPKTEGEVGVIHSRKLEATTQEQGSFVKFQPKGGGSFANFFVTCEEGKKIPAIEGTWECTGSVKGTRTGATVNFTHEETTAQNTLKCKGAKAGIEGSATKLGKAVGEEVYKPLSTTTVTT